jgi:hypothetical protein
MTLTALEERGRTQRRRSVKRKVAADLFTHRAGTAVTEATSLAVDRAAQANAMTRGAYLRRIIELHFERS